MRDYFKYFSASRPTKRRAPTLVVPVDAREPELVRNHVVSEKQKHFEEQEAELMVDDDDVDYE